LLDGIFRALQANSQTLGTNSIQLYCLNGAAFSSNINDIICKEYISRNMPLVLHIILSFHNFNVGKNDMTSSRVPEKYLQLNAAFQQLRTVLGRIGVKHLEIEGLLTGDPVACIHVLQSIFFSPLRANLANEFLSKYGLAQSNSDYKLVDTVFRIARTEFGITTRLSVEQFLNGGSFTVKRLELLTEIAISVGRRLNAVPAPAMDQGEKIQYVYQPEPKIRPVVVEEEESVSPQPVCIHHDPNGFTGNVEKFLHAAKCLHSAVKELEDKVCFNLESLDARLCIVEGRLRILDKLQPAQFARDT